MIDLVQLRTFVGVVERHLTRFAEWLHISLSAPSAHVRAVERTRANDYPAGQRRC